jgi:hypothetical protein
VARLTDEARRRQVYPVDHLEHGLPVRRLRKHLTALERGPVRSMRTKTVGLVLEACHQDSHLACLFILEELATFFERCRKRANT